MMPDKDGPAPFLTFARFRFHLRIQTLMVLPPYKGAVFRGAFGNVFRRLACVAPKANCPSCILRQRCLYVAIFEPPAPTGYSDAAKFSQAPRPYVLNPPLTPRQVFHPDETLDFELVLIGPAISAIPYFIHILEDMGRRGLGSERGKYELQQVMVRQPGGAFPVYANATGALTAFVPESGPMARPEDEQTNKVALEFLTPLRLKEKSDLVTHLSFPLFFDTLSRRLSLLGTFYGNNIKIPDFSLFRARTEKVDISDNDLRWFDWERYSRRQDAVMKLGGLMGRVTLHGDLGPFIPYLRLAEQVNIGQGTTFGLGRMRLAIR
ncbi:MAG: CRISPR system precrRNA processing endoribonuclease RAMP protein Cas6 [Deltaproteobacteria bacterium]|nr:CRISPR system precrRNA processing endoribonuclease RAMP protein Cas6 [Deltaproteobacteria bacterium]